MTAPHRYPPQAPPPYAQAPYAQAPYAQAPYAQAPWQQGPWQQHPQWAPPAPRPPIRRPWVIALVTLAVVIILATLALAAAGSGTTGSRTAGGTTRGGTTGPGATGTAPAANCPGGSLEGCYTEDRMPAFLEQAVTFVHGFSDDRYQRMPHPAGYQLIADGRSVQSPCGALDAMTYAYCPGDDRVYVGQQQLWQLYSGIGDAAAVVGLAHEYGHHIQAVAGVPDDRSPAAQVTHENQADCIAGAFVGWAQEKGYLEDGDTRDIAGLVRAIASSEDDPGRDHGTLAEREASLSTGIRDGLPGCSTFYPQTPVHQGS